VEALFEFLPIIIFVIYAVLRSRRAAEQKRLAQGGAPADKPGSLQQILQQIEEAMAEANGETEPPVQAAPLPAERIESAERSRTTPARPPSRAPAFASQPADEFRSPVRDVFAHDAHGFGTQNPYSEPVFQRVAPHQDAPASASNRLSFNPHMRNAGLLPLPNTTAPRRAAVLAERLRHPDAARDAIVLNAIFQRPGAPGRR
jgi:hypothetical protein